MAAVGRPALYKTPEEMQRKIDAYFVHADKKGDVYTVPGLADFLGFEDRHMISQTARERPQFAATIKRARQRIEQQRINMLIQGKGNAIGAIFDLKNNFGYKDSQTVEINDLTQVVASSVAQIIADYVPAEKREAAIEALQKALSTVKDRDL